VVEAAIVNHPRNDPAVQNPNITEKKTCVLQ
jgi:hypothetical protein